MIFEILIAYQQDDQTDILVLLCEILNNSLNDYDNEFEAETIKNMVIPCYQRQSKITYDEIGNAFSYMLLGFRLELPDDTDQSRIVVDQFISTLQNTPPIFHVIIFEDSLLLEELSRRAAEIFALEMKLRRVLTLIYLHAYQDGNPYDLLCDEALQPMAKEKPTMEHMKAVAENQFFHLTFSQYIGLNKRSDIRLLNLLEIVQNKEEYDVFRTEIMRLPIENEDDILLLAALKECTNAIETMRNCIAHNRRPSKTVAQNYEKARPLLDQLLDDYLSGMLL